MGTGIAGWISLAYSSFLAVGQSRTVLTRDEKEAQNQARCVTEKVLGPTLMFYEAVGRAMMKNTTSEDAKVGEKASC